MHETQTNPDVRVDGPWLQTFSGRVFTPLNPRPEDVSWLDIAHALSQLCRFTGHTKRFYSVAEHSVRVHDLVRDTGASTIARRAALLHDASEAYLHDLPGPLKTVPEFEWYRQLERRVQQVVLFSAGIVQLGSECRPVIKMMDQVMLSTEARYLLGEPPAAWAPGPEPLLLLDDGSELGWEPRVARSAFLRRLSELGIAAEVLGRWPD